MIAQVYTLHPIKDSLMHWLHDIFSVLYSDEQLIQDAYLLRRKELSDNTVAFNRRWRCRLPNAPAHVGFCLQNALRPSVRTRVKPPAREGTASRPTAMLTVILRYPDSNVTNTASAQGADESASMLPSARTTLYPLDCDRSTPTLATRLLPPPAAPPTEPANTTWPTLPCGPIARQIVVLATHSGEEALGDSLRKTVHQQVGVLLRTLVATLAPCPTHVTLMGAGQGHLPNGTAHALAAMTQAMIQTLPTWPSWLTIRVLAVQEMIHQYSQRRLPILLTAATQYLTGLCDKHGITNEDLVPTLLVPLGTIFQRDPFDLLDGRFTQLTVTAPVARSERMTSDACGGKPHKRGVQVLPAFALGHAPIVQRYLMRLVAFMQRSTRCNPDDTMQPFVWGEKDVVVETPLFIAGHATSPHVSLRNERQLRADALVRAPDSPDSNGTARCAIASTAGPVALIMDYWHVMQPVEPGEAILPQGNTSELASLALAGAHAAPLRLLRDLAPPLPDTFVPTVI